MRGQRIGMRVAVAEGRVVGGSHPHRGDAQMMPMSVVLLRAQRGGHEYGGGLLGRCRGRGVGAQQCGPLRRCPSASTAVKHSRQASSRNAARLQQAGGEAREEQVP
jgi:hypothetical protein